MKRKAKIDPIEKIDPIKEIVPIEINSTEKVNTIQELDTTKKYIFKKTYIGSLGHFIKGQKYCLTNKQYQVLHEDVE
jgi:hypothetical protein